MSIYVILEKLIKYNPVKFIRKTPPHPNTINSTKDLIFHRAVWIILI